MTISAGFVYSQVPGAGQGANLHTEFTNNLSADWTVHPQVTFGAANTLRVYFVLEHSSGAQILFYAADGSDADGNNGLAAGNRSTSFPEFTHQTIWAAYDVNGGGGGSDSFYDNLYNNGLDPANAGFWNQSVKTRAHRLGLWLEGWTTCYLWVCEGEADMDLVFLTSTDEPGEADRVQFTVFSDQLIDDSSRAAGDRPDSRAGSYHIEPDSSSPPTVKAFRAHIHLGGQMVHVTDSPVGYWMLDQNDDPIEPDGDGRYLLQTIPAEEATGSPIRGVFRKDLAAFTGPDELIGKTFGNTAGAAFMCGPRAWCCGYWGPLGDITA